MSGINDIKSAFSKAAPGIDLRAVRMRYEDSGAETVLEFDICGPDGSKRTVEERLPSVAGMKPLLDVAMKIAQSLGATVTQDSEPVTQDIPIAQQTAQGLAKLAGETTTVEHDGETYELAVDGKPKALFF
jgi:hypothetical protein